MPSPKAPPKPEPLAADLDDPFGSPLTAPADLDDPFGDAPSPSSTSITAAPPRVASIPVEIEPLDEPVSATPPAPARPIPAPPPLPKRAAPALATAPAPAPAPALAPAPAPILAPPPPPTPTTSAGPDAPSILVVDDDPSIRTMVARALGLHYTVYEAADGVAALEALAQLPNLRAIVCDVMMPRLDGLAVAKKMKSDRSLPRIPIIFLTAKDGAFDVVEGINAGARHYLVKPFKVKELLEKVASVVGGSAHMKAR